MPQYLRIICFLKGYKKRRVDGRTDTKEGKQHLAELMAEIKKAEPFEKNEQLSYISDSSASPTYILDDLPTSSDSDSPSPSFQMPRPTRHSRLSHPLENLSGHLTYLLLERLNIILHLSLQLLKESLQS